MPMKSAETHQSYRYVVGYASMNSGLHPPYSYLKAVVSSIAMFDTPSPLCYIENRGNTENVDSRYPLVRILLLLYQARGKRLGGLGVKKYRK